MQEPTFLILTALAAQPLHGYGIIQSVAVLSDNEVKLRPGTLYGALDRLTDQGLIVVDREEAVDGRLRRYYRLSDNGAATLSAQAERLHRHATAAETQLRRRPGLAGGAAFGAGAIAVAVSGAASAAGNAAFATGRLALGAGGAVFVGGSAV